MKIDWSKVEVNEFLNTYIEGSQIKEITYLVAADKWILKFKDDSKLSFEDFSGMVEWIHGDQFGE